MRENAARVVHRLNVVGVVERVLGVGIAGGGNREWQDAHRLVPGRLFDVVGRVDRDACRPSLREIRQSGRVASMLTSQLTAPAGS